MHIYFSFKKIGGWGAIERGAIVRGAIVLDPRPPINNWR